MDGLSSTGHPDREALFHVAGDRQLRAQLRLASTAPSALEGRLHPPASERGALESLE